MMEVNYQRRAKPLTTRYLGNFAALLFVYVSLYFGFYGFILDAFQFDYMEQRWLSVGDTYVSTALALAYLGVVCHIASTGSKKASDFFLLILAICPIFPMLILYSYRGAAPGFVAATVCCYALIASICRAKGASFVWRAPLVVKPKFLVKATFVLGLSFVVGSILAGNLAALNFSFEDVYQYRRAAASYRNAALTYLLTNLVALLIPLTLALLMDRRRYVEVVLLLVMSVVIFGLTSHKSHLFSALLVIATYLALQTKYSEKAVLVGFGSAVIISTLLFVSSDSSRELGTILIRRIFFVPAYANYLYFEFFSVNPFVFWSDSKLTVGLFDSPYSVPAPQVIMNHYTGIEFSTRVDEFGNANTGFLGAGYGQAGYFGMAIYSCIIGAYLRASDQLAEHTSVITTSAALLPFFMIVSFASTDTVSTLLTYGGLVLVVLAASTWKNSRKSIDPHRFRI